MRRIVQSLLLSTLMLTTFGDFVSAQVSPRTPGDLEKAINKLIQEDRYENATWGIHVVDVKSGKTLYRHNEKKSFMPASNMKLYTTAAALNQLGPDFSYETRLYAFGTIVDSVLHGHLVVKGSGDPTIGGRTEGQSVITDWEVGDGDATAVFAGWADSLKAAGIARVAGDIIGDDNVFDDTPFGVGWNWDDELYWYNPELSGLVYNDNCVDVTIDATSVGRPGTVDWAPNRTNYVTIVNATLTTPRGTSLDEGYERTRGSNTITLSSKVAAGRQDTELLTVSNPTRYFVHVLRETLVAEGITVDGRPVDVDDGSLLPDYDNEHALIVARHHSPPMSQIVAGINKPSNNLWAEQVLKTIGLVAPPDTVDGVEQPRIGTSKRGARHAMVTFAAAGVDTSRFRMTDGSGLSRMDLITPEMSTNLLRFMIAHDDSTVSGAFYRSLPIGGVDGTVENLITGGPAVGNMRAKTGTLTSVRSLSGYITSAAGSQLAFSMMSNNYTVKTKEINEVQRAFVDLLARYRR